MVSLAILGITDHLDMANADEVQTIHRIVEATKKRLPFGISILPIPAMWLRICRHCLTAKPSPPSPARFRMIALRPWGTGRGPGDTVWMGVMDSSGLSVSFIQSIYHEFGSGVVVPGTGLVWQNRGAAFSLDPDHMLALAPGKQPFHTLNPAAARLKDGRTMVYGSMGGDGQPQTQAAIFTRHVIQRLPLQQAVSAPRWLLGRTWGQLSDSLKLESRFAPDTPGGATCVRT